MTDRAKLINRLIIFHRKMRVSKLACLPSELAALIVV